MERGKIKSGLVPPSSPTGFIKNAPVQDEGSWQEDDSQDRGEIQDGEILLPTYQEASQGALQEVRTVGFVLQGPPGVYIMHNTIAL